MGGPTGGPTSARQAARRVHDRPPLGHLHTKFQCCSSNSFRDMSKKWKSSYFYSRVGWGNLARGQCGPELTLNISQKISVRDKTKIMLL